VQPERSPAGRGGRHDRKPHTLGAATRLLRSYFAVVYFVLSRLDGTTQGRKPERFRGLKWNGEDKIGPAVLK
jgi:hypothetical protein